jgi:uncharacterized membrane protein
VRRIRRCSTGLRGDGWLLVGAALYVVSFAVTAIYHIPRNNAFDSVAASGAGAAKGLARLRPPVGAVDHVRAVAALAGATSMVVGLLARSA